MSAPTQDRQPGRDGMIARMAFAHTRNVCVGTAREFAARGVTPEDFFSMEAGQLAALTGLRSSFFDREYRYRALEQAAAEYDFVSDNRLRAIFYTDPDYPTRLLECDDAPAILYVAGRTSPQARHVVAIVGTRHCTTYGQSVTSRLVADLAEALDDLLIVSGLAYGVDIAAHRAALKVGVPTGAVLAHGLNTVYPSDHRNEAVAMVREGGFLASEYRSCDPIHRGNFLARNRIVAGLADVTVVVESDLKGGAMTTAGIASAYQREVMAVPGRVFDTYSRGCNRLIAENRASIVRDAGDIIEACGWTRRPVEGVQSTLALDISDEQRTVMHFVNDHPEATINEIAIAMGLTIPRMQSMLFEMEMSDLIVSIPGNRYGVTAPLD